MKFSIVITTYNRLTLLQRAIDSALTQTMPCEVVVVDDCSSDGTQAYVQERCEALASVGDRRLIYHRN
jgi:glycosyltransferase involved in cell wall biosynthesis